MAQWFHSTWGKSTSCLILQLKMKFWFFNSDEFGFVIWLRVWWEHVKSVACSPPWGWNWCHMIRCFCILPLVFTSFYSVRLPADQRPEQARFSHRELPRPLGTEGRVSIWAGKPRTSDVSNLKAANHAFQNRMFSGMATWFPFVCLKGEGGLKFHYWWAGSCSGPELTTF